MSLILTAVCRLRQVLYRRQRRSRRAIQISSEEGPGSVFSVAQILRSNRLRKPLLVIGKGAEDWRGRILHALEESDIPYALWEDLPAEPTAGDGENLRLAWIREACDCFIALGDGDVIDIVKAAAARAACRGQTILSMVGRGKIRRKKLPPVVAIPTVAGSGVEALAWAAIADENGNRMILDDPALIPPFAVLDPELMEHISRPDLADAAMDGLCLAVEAYLSGYSDETARNAAAEAVTGFFSAAEPCWNSGGTIPQRTELLRASRMAGIAASRAGGGYARALSRAVMTVSGAGFGEACAGILPAVLEKYGNHAADRLSSLAEGTGVSGGGTKAEKAAELIRRIRQLAFRVGLPELSDAVSPDMIEEIADLAAAEANPWCACPSVWTAETLAEVLKRACAARGA